MTATIKAKYYFGAPVAEAKVKYKVTRTAADERWYPAARWDWLYGPGYWWFAADYAWYPGWSRWGILRPVAVVVGPAAGPPEVVVENEVAIGPDGTVDVEIDTALAKAGSWRPGPQVHDHRRGGGRVAPHHRRHRQRAGGPQAVQVYTWVDRGHYRAGDTIEASFQAQTLDHKPVAGKGEAEAAARSATTTRTSRSRRPWRPGSWHRRRGPGQPEDQGRRARAVPALGQGDDGKGHTIEGGYVFAVRARASTASFRFNDLELVTDKQGIPARRQGEAADQHQPGQLHRAALRPADQRRLPAAEGASPQRQEHGRGDRRSSRGTCRTSSSRR